MTPINDKFFHVNNNRCVSLLYCFYVFCFLVLFFRKQSCFLRCSRVPYCTAETKDQRKDTRKSGNYNTNQDYPSEIRDSERHVTIQDREIDSETYYRFRRDHHDRSQNRDNSRYIQKPYIPRANQGKSPEGNYSGILRDRSKTPPGHIRKDPPLTPAGTTEFMKAQTQERLRLILILRRQKAL